MSACQCGRERRVEAGGGERGSGLPGNESAGGQNHGAENHGAENHGGGNPGVAIQEGSGQGGGNQGCELGNHPRFQMAGRTNFVGLGADNAARAGLGRSVQFYDYNANLMVLVTMNEENCRRSNSTGSNSVSASSSSSTSIGQAASVEEGSVIDGGVGDGASEEAVSIGLESVVTDDNSSTISLTRLLTQGRCPTGE